MVANFALWSILMLPVLTAGLCLLLGSPKRIMWVVAVGGGGWAVFAGAVACTALSSVSITAARNWLLLDALSAYHMSVLAVVFGASSIYARRYFQGEISAGTLSPSAARKFGALWFGSVAAMASVLLCNNLGFMWVGIEATTLLTAFLICVHITPLSLEAMWKYLVVCSVGVAFAFVGTLLVASAAQALGHNAGDMLLWTVLRADAGGLAPGPMKVAFIFLVVGYGTKAGLAPLHSWLPDAHSQAPAPVSALLSGFILNAALYCIMRYLPLVEAATGEIGWGRQLLVVLGIASMVVAAAFILFQHDGKRLLAYSSIEHMGIITLGLGLGGLGTFAGLWHVLNHSVCKTLAFFSVGWLGQMYGTHDLGRIAGAMRRSPVWGFSFFASVLVLIGVAPFAIFMSELQILRAAVDGHAYVILGIFLGAVGIVFVGALRLVLAPAWGREVIVPKPQPAELGDLLLVFAGLGLLLLLGLWLPVPLREAMESAAQIIRGGP
ncbi:MAG: hypothetical protein A2289_20550 [Deltaproteobacteria bacterium RIFOXYA12_FULL_58_15]|nr:MAG: hypothetical protein A2289_20550 [Deltaproteobacteria bacterium RIFOXYA12_FULL_58_15]